ncbi:hypothetical protein JYT48_02710 [Mariprofundus ferrooxydans]|nr:hypothetical protein [Mariprofundus ferrooxydans]
MPDAFIWYKANENNETDFLHWLDLVHEQADVRAKLFIRKDTDGDQSKATFMETYSDVSSATINRIEKLAANQPLFNDIQRQCESFVKIT